MDIKDNKPIKGGHFRQGYYKVLNESKYRGNKFEVIYRSGWELDFCKYLDTSPNITSWSSEPLTIPYLDSFDGKWHKYFPDFVFSVMVDGVEKVYVAEVKPMKDITKPEKPKRVTDKSLKNYDASARVYIKNMCKLKYATAFCKEKGWGFIFVTEEWFKQAMFRMK